MLTLPSSVLVHLAAEPVDLRRGHDGLVAIVRNEWRLNPYAGHLFVFLGRRLDRVKILVWDRNGFVLYYKRLSQGRFRTFLDDPLIPIHNNASEAALRIVALMRKNSLFFGNDEAGRRFMVLYSLIATCERHDVNPEAYLTDVLLRIHDHPKERVGELLPHRWKGARGSGFTVERTVEPSGAA